MVTINAYWDETIHGDSILFLFPEDEQGENCPEELECGWMREGLPALKEKAEALNLRVWIEEEKRFL